MLSVEMWGRQAREAGVPWATRDLHPTITPHYTYTPIITVEARDEGKETSRTRRERRRPGGRGGGETARQDVALGDRNSSGETRH